MTKGILSDENLEWLSKFRKKYSRNPAVLHIGNIANNAYNNSKLLIQSGLDSDVICYDYFHTMACPEWEDANFQSTFRDDNRPDWKQVNLQGFERPRWFAQGTQNTCLRYLTSKRAGSESAEDLWQELRMQSGLAASQSSSVSGPATLVSGWVHFRSRVQRLLLLLVVSGPEVALQLLIGVLMPRLPSWLLIPGVALLLVPLGLIRFLASPFRHFIGKQTDKFENLTKKVLKNWDEEFPDRVDRLKREDMLAYAAVLPAWADLMKQYDIVVGYSTDPIIPMLAEVPYFALEHGTIRDIPYAKTPTGRLCALSYRKAAHVFVTNFDCVSSAETLAPGRFTVINHPYDEDHGLSIGGASEARAALRTELDSEFVIFHPTRHDWVPGTGYADKSNDVLLKAFIELRKSGHKVGLVCCHWGKNVDSSRGLIEVAGLAKYVKWVAPLPITPFELMCRSSDLVADQFMLGAFGGVCFKAMAVGAPIVTYLDEALLLGQYPEIPPVVNCKVSDEIITRIIGLIDSPVELDRLGAASRTWMKHYHSKAMTVNAQMNQFRLNLPV